MDKSYHAKHRVTEISTMISSTTADLRGQPVGTGKALEHRVFLARSNVENRSTVQHWIGIRYYDDGQEHSILAWF